MHFGSGDVVPNHSRAFYRVGNDADFTYFNYNVRFRKGQIIPLALTQMAELVARENVELEEIEIGDDVLSALIDYQGVIVFDCGDGTLCTDRVGSCQRITEDNEERLISPAELRNFLS